ncbi:NUDIX domain-containing protein [bacterium]|nr:MAG: NUDIX domain-containing protein [bacterium]
MSVTVHNEPWQVYAENGTPLEGVSASRNQFKQSTALIMGAAHIWIWRKRGSNTEILLQRRSRSKSTWAGYLDISAAGHIDAGESPVQAAIREAKEEIDIDIQSEKLYYVFGLRTPLDDREFDVVYLNKIEEDVQFHFNDGEVEELLWKNLDEFEVMTRKPDKYNLVPQGEAYFLLLIAAIRRLSI